MSQRLTLDHPSFEKLLAAAWVLQCLHDQLHNQKVGHDETISEPVETKKPADTLDSQPAIAVVQHSSWVTDAESARDGLSGRSADDETLAELVEVQPAIETRTLNFDATVKVEPETVELQRSLHTEDVATAQASMLRLPVLEKLANNVNDHDEGRAWRQSASNLRVANLRTAFNRALDAFTGLRPAFRVNVTLRALRAAAIATPVWLLAMVAALLLLETWRHEPLDSAQAISTSSAPTAEAVVSVTPATLTTATRGIFDDNKRTANRKPRQPRPAPPHEVSHKHVTDPAVFSAVQGLSRYEVSGLRRRAKYGDAFASLTLGMAYEVGRNVPQNCVEATHWVMKAAELGNAAAQYNLGLRYRDGDGVPANRAESGKWLRKAATHRNRQAKLALKMLAAR